MIATYLLLVEIAKRRFYAVQAHPRRPPATQQQRHQRRIQRRAARFTHHVAHDQGDLGRAWARQTCIRPATSQLMNSARSRFGSQSGCFRFAQRLSLARPAVRVRFQ
jgi:hypothetical protein